MKRIKKYQIVLGISICLLALSGVAIYCLRDSKSSREITSVELREMLASKKIKVSRIIPTSYGGIYKVEGSRKFGNETQLYHVTTQLDQSQLKSLFEQANVKIQIPDSGAPRPWMNLAGTLVIVGLVGFLIYHQTHLGHARTSNISERPVVRFSDLGGIDEAKGEVCEVVDFLRDSQKYKRLGGKLPKGILLIGPPGTGKTMLAKAIACEAKASFFSIHGSDFTEVFVGVGAKRVRQLFRQAAKCKPAIIFIDEIDCVGKTRKLESHSEQQQTLNALLAAMDGFEGSEGIVVLAATNRPEDLDEALLRPGRFDRKVHVPYPDMKGRRAILQTHSEGKPIHDSLKALDVIAQTTPGMSGADLANLVNEAAIFCAQQDVAHITLNDLEAARDKVRYGKERKSMVLKQSEREMVAYHEAGHTVVHLQTQLLPPLYKVSIVPRGMALGATTLLPDEDQNLQSKKFLLEELRVLMGGRAAEKTFYDSTTNGASGDLDMARKIARKMVHEWGMGERLYYETEQKDAEAEINRLLESADREAYVLIQEQKANTDKLAKALLTHETLTRLEVLELLKSPAAG